MRKPPLKQATTTLLEEFLEVVKVITYTPTPEAITRRLHELEVMGLDDEPEFPGISSPVRQYALNTLVCDMAQQAGDPRLVANQFLTEHPGLLAQADQLNACYGLCPISPREHLALRETRAET